MRRLLLLALSLCLIAVAGAPGGASMIGTQSVVDAAPDGYTVLIVDSALLTNPGLFGSKLPYDTLRQLTGELFKLVAGIGIVHVPYRGTAPALNDLLAGRLQMMFGGISSSRPFVEAGKLRAVAMSASRRNPVMPDVPTFEEAGLKGVNAESYWGLHAPTGTPAEAVKALNEHFVGALRQPKIVDQLSELGFEVIANSPQEHTAQVARLIGQWAETIKKAGIKME